MKYKNIICLIICLAIMPMVFALPSGTVYKYEPALLAEGWNGVGIIPDYDNLTKGDFNISLVNDSSSGAPNLLGMSFTTPNGKCIPLTSLTFWDSDDNSYNYEDAKTNNWIEPIEFTENLETTGEIEEFNTLCPYEAIWIKSYLAVNMTVSDVLGSPIGETFDWADLRFSNETDELNASDAQNANWWEGYVQYWDTDNRAFKYVCSSIWTGMGSAPSSDCLANSFNSYQGYFINSNFDNIYLLTNNETKSNVHKVKVNAKYIGANKIHKVISRAKYVGANKVYKPSFWN